MATETYKNPIVIICIKSSTSTKIIKGCQYLAIRLYGPSNERYVQIKDVGTYKAEYFTLLDGTSLKNVNDFSIQSYDRVIPNVKDYTGQYVKCVYSSSKYLKEDEIYYVEQQIKGYKYNYTYRGTKEYEYYFKLKNIKNKVNTYRFKEIPLIEQRNIKLKNINGDTIKTGDMTRKFLLYNEIEKNTILFNLLSRSLYDINKIQNKNNIKELIIKMMLIKGKCCSILKEEIESFLNNNINDLINMN